jgi:hypothetical protein
MHIGRQEISPEWAQEEAARFDAARPQKKAVAMTGPNGTKFTTPIIRHLIDRP